MNEEKLLTLLKAFMHATHYSLQHTQDLCWCTPGKTECHTCRQRRLLLQTEVEFERMARSKITIEFVNRWDEPKNQNERHD